MGIELIVGTWEKAATAASKSLFFLPPPSLLSGGCDLQTSIEPRLASPNAPNCAYDYDGKQQKKAYNFIITVIFLQLSH